MKPLLLLINHEHDIVSYAKCPRKSCTHDDVAESGRRALESVKDHNGRDTSSYFLKRCIVADHRFDGLRIVGTNYLNNKSKQKTAKTLLIKNLKPSLNVQDKSVALKLFN